MSAYENAVLCLGFEAEADLSAKIHHFVKNGTAGEQVLAADVASVAIGVLQNKPGLGDNADVMLQGVSIVESSASISKGNFCAPDAAGKARVATSGDYPAGIALEDGASGEAFAMLIIHSSIALP